GPVLVEPALDQSACARGREADRVRVQEHGRRTSFQIRDDLEDLRVEERFADPVEYYAIEDGELLGDGLDLRQRELGRRLEALESADARLAFRIAAIGRLEIERPRQRGDDGRASGGGHVR